MRKRLIVLIVVVVVWAGVVFALSHILPEKQARVTALPLLDTRTPQPTFTATDTATPTLVPSATPTPTNTPTPTPVPTNTPIPTNTPLPSDTPSPTLTPTITDTPLPTNTPTATVKPTTRPTRPPTKTPVPKPTNTPPPPFTGKIVRGYTNCGGYRGITGLVKHANGAPYGGVAVGVWSNDWDGRVSVSEASGKFELSLSDLPPGTFNVAAVKLETCTLRDGLPTARDCQRVSNAVTNVTTSENCTGAGANQVTEIEFVGP